MRGVKIRSTFTKSLSMKIVTAYFGGRRLALTLLLLVPLLWTNSAGAQFGTIFSGTGPVNRSFGGVAVAAPLSPAGAMYWNPATLSGFQDSQLEAGAELLFPHTETSSRIAADSLGPGLPPLGLMGKTESDSGAFPLPMIGLVVQPENSPVSYGLGIFAVAGFGVDYSGDATNFPLSPPPPAGLGFGPIFSEFQVLQIAPAISVRVTERLSIGAGPTVNLASLKVTPAIFAVPDDANADGFATYPEAVHYSLGTRLDFAQLVKVYTPLDDPDRRYSPASVVTAVPVPR